MEMSKWVLTFGDTTFFGGDCETSVKLSAQTTSIPKISATSTEGKLKAISVDNVLALLHDIEDVFCTVFKNKIDEFALLDGGYVAVGEENGTLTVGILEEENNFKVKQSCNLLQDIQDTTAFVRILFNITEGDETGSRACIISLSSTGLLMVFSHIILENGDINFSKVSLQKTATPHEKAVDVLMTKDHIITVGTGQDCMAVYYIDSDQLTLEDTVSLDGLESIVEVHALSNEDILVTRHANGQFYLWDLLTLTCVKSWTLTGVTDFRPLVENTYDYFSVDNMKLVVVQGKKVQTLALPSLLVNTECGVGADYTKLSNSLTSQDEILVAECITEEDDSETTVFLRCYAESDPQKRLQHLIAKRRFEEAEHFAKLNGLNYSLDPVIVQSRMREAKETYVDTINHLRRCKEQLLKNTSEKSSARQVLLELQEIKHRLESFKLVYGEENYTPTDWENFQMNTPLAMCLQLLMVDAEKAFLLWRCFQNELKKHLQPGLIQQVLERIPSVVQCKMVVEWLSNMVIPYIVVTDPGACVSIVEWMDNKVHAMELIDKNCWPDGAISECEVLLRSMEVAIHCDVNDVANNGLLAIKRKMNSAVAIEPLRTLIQHLQGLKKLKTKYNFHLPLDAFKQETEASIVFRMLDRVVAVDLLQTTLNQQILPYIQHHGLVPDDIFANYVKDLLQKAAFSHAQYSWREKVKAIIQLIQDPKEKVVAVLNILDHIMLPVPDFVGELVLEVISKVKHPLIATLSEKWSIKEADSIVFSYGLKPIDMKTSFQVLEVAKFIVASGGPITDAQKVLSVSQISSAEDELPRFVCQLFVQRNQIDQLADYLRSLSKKIAVMCCHFILCTAQRMMVDDQNPLREVMKQIRLQYFESVVKATSIMQKLEEDPLELDEIDKKAQIIKKAWALEIYYKIHVTDAILKDTIQCKAILSKFGHKQPSSTLISLCRLLNLQNKDALIVTTPLAETSDHRPFAKLLQQIVDVYSHGTLSDGQLYDVLSVIQKEADYSLPELCLKLAQLLLTFVPQWKIKSALEVCQLASLIKSIHSECQDSLDEKTSIVWEADYFKENSPSLESELVLPDLLGVLLEMRDGWLLDRAWAQLESAVQYLSAEGQSQLALRTLMVTLALIQPAAVSNSCEQDSQAIQERALEFAKQISATLVTKLLSCVPLDAQLALPYVLALPTRQGVSLLQDNIKSCSNNFKLLKGVSTMAFAVAEILGDKKLIDSCQRVKAIAKWGNRLSKIGIPFKNVSLCNIHEVMDALNELIKSPHCDANIITEYFSDFKLEVSELYTKLMQFFEACLTRHSEIGLNPDFLRKAHIVLHSMQEDKTRVLQMLKNQLQKTHAYNYEVLQFLLEEINNREESPEIQRGLELLKYISLYTRCSPPTAIEMKQCVLTATREGIPADLSQVDLLPDISSKRLPYHHLLSNDRWAVITPEVNPQTLSMWLGMAPVLSMKRDNFVVKAALNLIDDYTRPSVASATTATGPVSQEFLTLLAQVNKILAQMEEKDSAMMCCHAMLEKLTNVGEKATALQGCVAFANKWLNSAEEPQGKSKAQKAVEMFSKKLEVLSTYWALCKAGLQGSPELKKLLKQPEDLIKQLYALPCVQKSHDFEQKAINSLCDEIAGLHRISLLDIRTLLLDKWLVGGASGFDLDQTMTFDVITDEGSEKDNLTRALYILKSKDREQLLEHVAEIANLGEGVINPITHRRALYCVLKIGTEEELARLLNRPL